MSQPDAKKRPVALVLYHYLYPDDVVSSILFTDLCTGLVDRGWRVFGSACNRGCRDEHQTYPGRLRWKGVEFLRIWRPRFRQASGLGRMANAVWMIVAWSLMAFDPRIRPDFVIIGTDPILSPVVVFAWRILRPRVRFAHWCHDLYPDAAIAAGLVRDGTYAVRAIQWLLGAAYRRQALIVDIGSCMRRRLDAYDTGAWEETIPPWALAELPEPAPIDPAERQMLFGDARLGLLYSGVFGRAHSWAGLPELARALADRGGRIAFSVGGNAAEDLRKSMQESGVPVTFAPMVPGDRLAAERRGRANRKSARELDRDGGSFQVLWGTGNWPAGSVSGQSGLGDCQVGQGVAGRLGAGSGADRAASQRTDGMVAMFQAKLQMFRHCHEGYQREFSRSRALDHWDRALRALN